MLDSKLFPEKSEDQCAEVNISDDKNNPKLVWKKLNKVDEGYKLAQSN
jgi:hypothetical protein